MQRERTGRGRARLPQKAPWRRQCELRDLKGDGILVSSEGRKAFQARTTPAAKVRGERRSGHAWWVGSDHSGWPSGPERAARACTHFPRRTNTARVGPESGKALAGAEQAVGHFKWPGSGSEETRVVFFFFFFSRKGSGSGGDSVGWFQKPLTQGFCRVSGS